MSLQYVIRNKQAIGFILSAGPKQGPQREMIVRVAPLPGAASTTRASVPFAAFLCGIKRCGPGLSLEPDPEGDQL